jgi:two-component system, NarL family, sensor kinase
MRNNKHFFSMFNFVTLSLVYTQLVEVSKYHTKNSYKQLPQNTHTIFSHHASLSFGEGRGEVFKHNPPLFLLLLLFISFSCTNKNSNPNQASNDSIEKYLQLASNDTLPFPERDKYNQKAYSLIDLSNNDSVVRWYLCESALNFNKTKNELKYYEISNIHFGKSKEAKDTLNLARYYRFRGGFHKNNTNSLDSAFYYYVKAEKMYKKTTDYEGLGVVYMYKGSILTSVNDFSGAELEFIKAKSIFKTKDKHSNYVYLLLEMGYNYKTKLEYNNAIKSYNDGIEEVKRSKNSRIKVCEVFLLTGLGNVYFNKGEFQKALSFYKKAKNIHKLRFKDINYYSAIVSNIAGCELFLNQNDSLPRHFFESLELSRSINNLNSSFSTLINLSNFYIKQKDTLKAQKYAEEALIIARKTKVPYDIMNALKQVGIVNKSKAAASIIEFDVQVDSLLNKERRERSKFLKIQLETDQITQEKETAIKQKWVIASIISSVLLIVILLFVIHRQRAKQKEMQMLQTQQKANEDIYQLMLNQQAKVEEARQIEKKRIALELHDGIMNKLASTRLNLFVLTKKTDQQTINNCLTYIEDIHEIENEIRNVSHDLNQELFLEKDSFKMLLKQFVKDQNSHNKTHYELLIAENVNWELISSQTKMHLYRIIQEASHNINKYAQATQAIISFTTEENQLCLTITDNGSGFDTTKIKEGIGLQNMQQRSQELQGVFSIASNTNGTKLHFKIPIV